MTGVYGTTGARYPMPCMFVMSSNAKEAKDFQIDPAFFVGLPVVRVKYADSVLTSDYPSHVAVRHSGSVDTYLWHEVNRAVYIPCFTSKISVKHVRDPITKKLISGPLVCKTDGGPDRLSKEAESINFQQEMAAMGVQILLSLQMGLLLPLKWISCTQSSSQGVRTARFVLPVLRWQSVQLQGRNMPKKQKSEPAKGWTVWRRVVRATARLLVRRRVGGVHAI